MTRLLPKTDVISYQSAYRFCVTAEKTRLITDEPHWHGAWIIAAQSYMATLATFSPKRGCILLVEDRDDVRQGLAQLLEFNGFLVEEARDGRAALGHLERDGSEIALVVLDLTLPGSVSGRDIRGWMLANPLCADIPTIIVTASEIDAPGRAGLCPTAWLEKPFRFDQLLDLVKHFVVPEAPAVTPLPDPPAETGAERL